jgi:hypothetical protein
MDEAELERNLSKLRKQGWGEAKIARWLEQKRLVEGREERLHPPAPWSDKTTAAAKEQLFARYGNPFDHFDRETALAIIDDAERLGLVILPGCPGYQDKHSIQEFFDVIDSRWWTNLAHEAYERGGKAEAVSAAAEATRNFVRDGFPDGANAMSFFVYL